MKRVRNEPGTLVVRRRLGEICLVQLSNLKQVCYNPKRGAIALNGEVVGTYSIMRRIGGGTHGCSQTSSITDRQHVQPFSRPTAPLNDLHDPISTPLTHGPILPEIYFMYGPPRLDHLQGNLFNGRVCLNARVKNLSDFIEGSTEVNRSRSGKE